MNNLKLKQNARYVLAKNAVGYGIYEKPYYYEGHRYCGLIKTDKSKEYLETALKESGCKYIEINIDPDKVDYQEFGKLFKEKYDNVDINN